MMTSAFGEVDSKTPFVSVKPDNFQGSPISNLFMHQPPHSVSLGTVLHFSLIPWSPYLHNKPPNRSVHLFSEWVFKNTRRETCSAEFTDGDTEVCISEQPKRLHCSHRESGM